MAADLEALAAEERLRDEFAMAALTGIMASGRVNTMDNAATAVARSAYRLAEAMMRAR